MSITCKNHIFILLIFICFFTQITFAQSTFSVTGSVIEKDTDEVIPGVQIFLNGTTIGTTSDENGKFVLNNIPEGVFDLNASILGYQNVSVTIITSSLEPSYNFILTPKVYELDEVTVKPDLKEWKINFEIFRDSFIGEGPFSKDTKIKNPEVLSFDFDPYDRVLKARAYDKLIIENNALGYLITYYLDFFEIDYKISSTYYFGRPFFSILDSKRKRVRSRWEKNRKSAYKGSFLHFKRSLIEGTAVDQGFISRSEKREERARYMSKDAISNSLYFYRVDSTNYKFSFSNFVNVTFENENEDKTYLEYIQSSFSRNPRTVVQAQSSSFTLTQDSVLIHKSGYVFNPLAIILDGYWAFEKISDMMPLNYIPEESLTE